MATNNDSTAHNDITASNNFETIQTETRGRVGIITLDRPKALNALNQQLMIEIISAAQAFDGDDGIGCIVLTGPKKPSQPALISKKWRINLPLTCTCRIGFPNGNS